MITSMNDEKKDTQKAQVMWFKEPETLAEFDPECWHNTPNQSYRSVIMLYLYRAMYRPEESISEYTRHLVRKYLCEFPEFTEEVRQVRPELLEM